MRYLYNVLNRIKLHGCRTAALKGNIGENPRQPPLLCQVFIKISPQRFYRKHVETAGDKSVGRCFCKYERSKALYIFAGKPLCFLTREGEREENLKPGDLPATCKSTLRRAKERRFSLRAFFLHTPQLRSFFIANKQCRTAQRSFYEEIFQDIRACRDTVRMCDRTRCVH